MNRRTHLLLIAQAVAAVACCGLLPAAEPNPEAAPARLKLLTWNIQMLPTFPSVEPLRKMQAVRAPWIVEFLSAQDYDVVVLEEVIDKKITEELKSGLKPAYPYIVSVDAKRGLSGCSGGILFASKIPLKYVDHIVYKHISGVDAMAEKGVVLVELELGGMRLQIAGTHMQAGDDQMREKEIPEIYEGIIRPHHTAGVPQILAGDLNIGADEEAFQVLLKTTEMSNFPLDDPHPYTTDGENSWNRPNKRPGTSTTC